MGLNFGEDTSENLGRLGELMLYVASKCHNDRAFGATKLNKILWMADFRAFEQLGEPLTGVRYRKQQHGPVATSAQTVKRRLAADSAAEVLVSRYYGRKQHRLVPLREHQAGVFSQEQLDVVDDVIESLKDFTGTEASNVSHESIAWRVPQMKAPIPYEAVFLSMPTDDEVEVARQYAKEEGWL